MGFPLALALALAPASRRPRRRSVSRRWLEIQNSEFRMQSPRSEEVPNVKLQSDANSEFCILEFARKEARERLSEVAALLCRRER
jgi:hypothetical protein